MTAVLLTLVLLAPPDLVGRVVATDGKPVAGARVLIGSAHVRQGTSPLCPSCFPDCRKQADTDSGGRFRIAAVDPALSFDVVVIADGYRPALATKSDPTRGPVEVRLTPFDPAQLDPKRVLRGVVLGPDDRPLVGARVAAPWVRREGRFGSNLNAEVFDPVAVTNLRGEFVLAAKVPFDDANLRVEGPGVAPRMVAGCKPEANPQRIRMTVGATLTGRLVRDGKPVAGAGVGLLQVNRILERYLGALSVGTDSQGRFTFANVHPDEIYYLYGLMGTMNDAGGVAARQVHVGGEGATTDAGVLPVEPGHRIKGRVVLSDGKPIPPKTRLMVRPVDAWDSREVELGPDGRFEVAALPTEVYELYVNLKGYRPSPKNHSVDRIGEPFRLIGTVDQDIDTLEILMEPGSN
jgi:hypothetical protein